jgi:hypothetical protein
VALLDSWNLAKIVSVTCSFTFMYFWLLYAEVACEGGRWLLQVSPALTSRNLPFFCSSCLCVSYSCRNDDCFPVRLRHQSFNVVVANLVLEMRAERGLSQAYHAGDSSLLPVQSTWDLCWTVYLVGQVFLQILRFSTVIIILSVFHTRLHFRLILAAVRHSFQELTVNVA